MIATRAYSGQDLLTNFDMDGEVYRLFFDMGHRGEIDDGHLFAIAMEMAANAQFALRNIPNKAFKQAQEDTRLVMEYRKGFFGLRMTNIAQVSDAARAAQLHQKACYWQDEKKKWHKKDAPTRRAAMKAYREKVGTSNRVYDEHGVRHNIQGRGIISIAGMSDVFHLSVHEAPDDYPVNLCYVRTIAGFKLGNP